eukprot:241080-Prymnesium_polylepis.1
MVLGGRALTDDLGAEQRRRACYSDLYVNTRSNMETILVNHQYSEYFDIDGLELIRSKHMVAMLGDDEYDQMSCCLRLTSRAM